MKTKLRFTAQLGMAAAAMLSPAAADVVYSGLLDTPIPTNFTGVTVTINGGILNPFFGGVGVANNNLLQPARDGSGNLDTILNFGVGSSISSSLTFATGYGGSQDHLGNTFTTGQEGYLGFKVNGTNYGWMRVVFTADQAGAVVKDWAYDNSGTSIVVGRVAQTAAVNGTQTVNLTPGTGESFTLGSIISNTGGNVNNVVASGAGTTSLSGANTYSGGTLVSGGMLRVVNLTGSGTGSGAVTVTGGTLGGDGTIDGAVTIEDGAYVALGSGDGNLTLHAGIDLAGTYLWQLDELSTANPGSGYDRITVSGGDINVAGADLGLNLGANVPTAEETFWLTNHTWEGIIHNTGSGSIFGAFNEIDNTQWETLGAFSTTNTANGVNLYWTPVPEPQVLQLLGGLTALALLRRRRK